MLPLTRSRNRARFFGTPFSPEALFAGGTVAGAWYDPSDLSTMFTTSAGTTQCAMPGQGSAVSVGLMLDKSQGLVLGPELVTNGTFDTNTNGWFASSGLTSATRDTTIFFTGGLKIVANGVAQSYATQTISGLTVGKMYVISTSAYTPSTNPANNCATIGIQPSSFTAAGSIAQSTTNTIQTLTISFFATNTTQTIYCSVVASNFLSWGVNGAEAYFDNISVRELPGNHAIAFNDTTARPELRARVNLLTYSEEFDNGAWAKFGLNAFGSGSVANTTATLDPLGGNTADFIQENTANSTHEASQIFSVGSSVRYSYAVYVKAAGRNWCQFILGPSTHFGTGGISAYFDLANGAVGTVTSNPTALPVATIQSVGNGWYLCALSATSNAAVGTADCYVRIAQNGSTVSYTGDGTSGIYIWGADLRPANIGANVPAYQRIADANTYDTSGFPLYLRFDGIDDSMYTPANLNLSGTDKVAVFAGVRKLSDAWLQIIAETSSVVDTNNGALAIGNSIGGAQRWLSALRGTSLAYYEPATYEAPITNVLSTSFDIAGVAISSEIVPRINGVIDQDNPAGASAGTGNFGTYPLYIGARNNASFFFNGHLHSLIIAGSAVSAGNISAAEQWVAGKVGIQI